MARETVQEHEASLTKEAHGSFVSLLFKWYGRFLVGFVLFCALMGVAEWLGLPKEFVGYGFLLLTLALYAGVGIATRTGVLDEYYVAGRRVPAFFNGMATGADWMSAASFISMAGTLYALGYEGLSYIMGWTGGYVLLALLLAPYIRKFGQYTIPDFLATRFDSNAARVTGAVCGIIVSLTYVTAQVTGVGLIMSRFIGVDFNLGVIIGLSAVLLCSFLGGMKAVTWTQVAQYLILIIAYLIPVTFLAIKLAGNPIPQLAYGQAFDFFAKNPADTYAVPYNDWTGAQFFALLLCLMLGTAGLPHILIRFYTVPSVRQARRSVGWALFFIFLLYFTAPAYAALTRWEILQNVNGQPFADVQSRGWVQNWSKISGMMSLTDTNSNGRVDSGELRFISTDMVVLATPEIAGLPYVIVALVAAGGLAAALSTADGLLVVISSALSHDVYYRVINPRASPSLRLKLGKGGILVAAAISALLAVPRLSLIAETVAWAFSLAAATFFPTLVMGIFWKRFNSAGAIATLSTGLIVSVGYIVWSRLWSVFTGYVPKTGATTENIVGNVIQAVPQAIGTGDAHYRYQIFGIFHTGAGLFGLITAVIVGVIVTMATKPPSESIQRMVEALRRPVIKGEGDTAEGMTYDQLKA